MQEQRPQQGRRRTTTFEKIVYGAESRGQVEIETTASGVSDE